jgi:hypothetical protein
MRQAEAGPMRKKSYQIVGDRLKLAQSAANVTFVTQTRSCDGQARNFARWHVESANGRARDGRA